MASGSTALAFLARLEPGFYFPVFLFRTGVLIYTGYVVGHLEGKRETATLQGLAVSLGLIGGSWDDWEIIIRFFPRVVMCLLLAITAMILLTVTILLSEPLAKKIKGVKDDKS
ncbi:MAG: hypothetical protein F6J89_17390 [Symploca sp. SIO1C4]|uniref:Uncharacterized protein n=1 Tax=Symploca sp. SIO1C4 TaxID=2607765 RepID=A0A6B3NH51_9CYAN|nr:hypothetical protein [Symploca sp. SIO1C4]